MLALVVLCLGGGFVVVLFSLSLSLFLFTQNGSFCSGYIFLYLYHFEVAGSQAEGPKKGNFSCRQENFFLALSFMKSPQSSFTFTIQKNLTLQKADILNPIISINNKL